MFSKTLYLLVIVSVFSLVSCSKKLIPSTTVQKDTTTSTIAPQPIGDTIGVKKITVKKKIKEPVPQVITVNDSGASKTADGRYYYDLEGRRYWRNNKNGKYYLFNKSMYGNADFKAL